MIAIFMIDVVAVVPAVIPFLFFTEPRIALRVSNGASSRIAIRHGTAVGETHGLQWLSCGVLRNAAWFCARRRGHRPGRIGFSKCIVAERFFGPTVRTESCSTIRSDRSHGFLCSLGVGPGIDRQCVRNVGLIPLRTSGLITSQSMVISSPTINPLWTPYSWPIATGCISKLGTTTRT